MKEGGKRRKKGRSKIADRLAGRGRGERRPGGQKIKDEDSTGAWLKK